MTTRILAGVIALFISAASYAQRDTISINKEWTFATDKKSQGLSDRWFEKPLPGARRVQIPHTWNIEKENENHYGWGWYQKKIAIPAHWKNKDLTLVFGAINHTAYIFINGKKIDENTGDGFNKFAVNLNGRVEYGKSNIITVACNNDYGRNKVPFGSSFDWPNDGGIIRTVNLIVSDKPAARYIHVEPKLNMNDSSGELKIKLGFDDATDKNIRFLVTVTEENQATSKVVLKTGTKPIWTNSEAC